MHHVKYSDGPYKTAVLIKRPALNSMELEKHYLQDIGTENAIGFSLDYGGKKKPTATIIKDYLASLLPALDSLGITTLYCADSEYFKKLTKLTKAEPNLGYVKPCAIDGYTHMNVIYGINYQSLFFDPKNKDKLALSLTTLDSHLKGTYTAIGKNIIKSEYYPTSNRQIKQLLADLHQYPELTCDFEAFSLFFGDAGIGTVGFAWDKHNGAAFCCDYKEVHHAIRVRDGIDHYGYKSVNTEIRAALKEFFETYKGKLIWHNANYDLKIAVYTLWMDDYLDYNGMLEGVEVMSRHFDDTKLLTYLATNSCAGNKLSLKEQAHEFAGNYAQDDINDIRLIHRKSLLRYNLIDCLSTWYVYEKHNDTVDKDDQREIYDTLFIPAVKQILQMELVGMPIHMPSVKKADKRLNRLYTVYNQFLQQKLEDMGYLKFRRLEEVLEYNTTRKVKRKTEDDFADLQLNPGSPKQLQHLLYEFFGLPEIDYTDTKQPATGTKTLKKLKNHVENNDQAMVIRCLIHISKVDKIISAFMPKFLGATPVSDGSHRLYGGFNLGGTVSGRLSSSKPNLQQIPSGSTYAKLIKNCFRAPKGWIFCGADYNSLEDYVSALTTRDPNKMKVYEEGYDGHCLRAYSYFKDKMPNIVDTVDSINSIKDLYPALRQDSKAPTFALTYQGTYSTLMNNCGFTMEVAKGIEHAYHDMYKVSDTWVQDRLKKANKDGYVTVAYGLRVRTPKIKKVIWQGPRMPREAAAEGRTAGNALGQSYGLVNTRAGVELQERTLESDYRIKILPCAHIHDAQYFLVVDEVGAVKWLNDNLVDCMRNHGLPELDWHPTVKIGAELDLFYPTWKDDINLKNNWSYSQIMEKVNGTR